MIKSYIVESPDLKIRSQLYDPKNLKFRLGHQPRMLGNIRQAVLEESCLNPKSPCFYGWGVCQNLSAHTVYSHCLLTEEVKKLARRRKRKSRRRQEGRRILECVPQYSIESGEDKPVTAARKFIHAEGIAPPALLLVKRNEHTTDRYFWAEKGLFGAQYVEENHFLFPSLKVMLEATAEKIPVVSASRA